MTNVKTLIALKDMPWTDVGRGVTRAHIDNIMQPDVLREGVAVFVDGQPKGVLLSIAKYERLMARIEELERAHALLDDSDPEREDDR